MRTTEDGEAHVTKRDGPLASDRISQPPTRIVRDCFLLRFNMPVPAFSRLLTIGWFALTFGCVEAAAPPHAVSHPPTSRPVSPRIQLPALGEEVPLARIHEICDAYGLRDLWLK